jgi:hypothetical protein
MDPERFKQAYARLDLLDDRLSFKIRSHTEGSRYRPGPDQIDERLRELAQFTLELKEILRELFLALGTKKSS